MCTAVSYKTKDTYFGRNLDLEFSYGEAITVMPRNFIFPLRHFAPLTRHYAIIGTCHISCGYPLYYDGMNEHGLAMAGLRFTNSALYINATGIASFEIIPYILCTCRNLKEAAKILSDTKITNDNFSNELSNTPLHWMLADKTGSLVIEQSITGLKIFQNPVGVLTNNPSFDRQINSPANPLSFGLSSEERFKRAAHVLKKSVSGTSESASISQFFHILDSVSQKRGLNITEHGYEITVYSSCMNLDRGIYYYKTYENSRITAVNLHSEDLNGHEIITYPMLSAQDIRRIN